MRVVADSHAALWYAQTSSELSSTALAALNDAEASEGIVVSVATLIDLWYVTQTTKGVDSGELADLRTAMSDSPVIELHPIDTGVADAFTRIDRSVLVDPWDRLIVATAVALQLPLVTKDGAIRRSGLVETLW